MKKVIFLLSSLTLLISCKKDSSNNVPNPDVLKAPYYFKCSADGKSVNFTNTVICQLPVKADTIINGIKQPSSSSSFLLQSNWEGVNTGQQIQILINGDSNFKIASGSIYTYPTAGIICTYIANPDPIRGSTYYAGWVADTMYIPFINNFQVAITSIDTINATIKGTFGGNTAGIDLSTLQQGVKAITNGEFFLPYKKP